MKSNRRNIAIIIGGVVMLAGTLMSAWVREMLIVRPGALPEAIARAQLLGIPTDQAEYLAFLGPSDDGLAPEQFAAVAQAAAQIPTAHRGKLSRKVEFGRVAESSKIDAIRAWNPVLNQVRTLAARPISRFERDFTKSSVSFKERPWMKEWAIALLNRGQYHVHGGRLDEARKDFRAVHQLAKHARSELDFLSLLLGTRFEAEALKAYANLITEPGITPEARALALELASENDLRVDFVKYMRGDAYVGFILAASKPEPGEEEDVRQKALLKYEFLSYQCNLLSDVLKAGNEPNEIEKVLLAQAERYSWIEPMKRVLADVLDGSSRTFRVHQLLLTRQAMVLSLSEVLAARGESATWPASLELTKRDPFGEGPLVYVAKEGGFDIVSVGIDRKSDAGETSGLGLGTAASDFVLMIRPGKAARFRGF